MVHFNPLVEDSFCTVQSKPSNFKFYQAVLSHFEGLCLAVQYPPGEAFGLVKLERDETQCASWDCEGEDWGHLHGA